MDNRALTVSVCGVVVGVIIAGGALALGAGPYAASVSDVVSFRTVPENIGNARARYIEESGVRDAEVPVRAYPTIREESASSSSVAPEAADPTSCETALSLAEDMRAAFKKALPRAPAARRELQDAVDALAATYCDKPAAASSSSSVKAVDNHCEQFADNTLRRTQCGINQARGVPYRGY